MAGDEGSDADIARGLERQAVEALKAWQARDAAAAVWRRKRLVLHLARGEDVPGIDSRGLGVGDIDGLLVRPQTDPVRRDDRIDQLGNTGAVGQRQIRPTMVAM